MKKIFTFIILSVFVLLTLVSCEDTSPSNSTATELPATEQTEQSNSPNVTPENTVCQHTFGEWVTLIESTCAEEGKAERICTECSLVETKTLEKSEDHEEVIDKETPATCTEEGLTEGKHCSVCNAVIVKQEKIAALDHKIETDKALAPTCSLVGLTEGSHCRRCNTVFVKQEVIPKLEHNFVNNKCTCGITLESKGLDISSNGTSCVVRGIGNCTDTCVVIPSTYEGLPVTFIDANAFSNLTNVEEIIIPESVTGMGSRVFYNCKSLKSVILPSKIERLPSELFVGCSSLENVTLPKALFRIESGFFSGCTSLKKITLPDDIRYISEHAFSGCKSLKEVILPVSLEEIEQFAFYGCDSIETVRYMGSISLFREVGMGVECFGNNHPPIICIDGEYYEY